MNLTEKQKIKIKEAYNILKLEEKENLKKTYNALNDEELKRINGGSGDILDFVKEGVGHFGDWVLENLFFGIFSSDDKVQGPKINVEKCPMCNLLIPSSGLKDHMWNTHKEELIELIKQSGIF